MCQPLLFPLSGLEVGRWSRRVSAGERHCSSLVHSSLLFHAFSSASDLSSFSNSGSGRCCSSHSGGEWAERDGPICLWMGQHSCFGCACKVNDITFWEGDWICFPSVLYRHICHHRVPSQNGRLLARSIKHVRGMAFSQRFFWMLKYSTENDQSARPIPATERDTVLG